MAMICLRQHSYPYCLTRARSAHAFMGQGVPKRLQARAGPESTLPACPGVSDASISRQPAEAEVHLGALLSGMQPDTPSLRRTFENDGPTGAGWANLLKT